MAAEPHLWTVADRRAQLGQLRKLAREIRKRYRTDAYDTIIEGCDRFLTKGFTEDDLKAFSREVGTPPGWTHPRSDNRLEQETDDPRLVRMLDRVKELVEELRTSGEWTD